MERIAALYKALSEPARLRILALLMRHGELCACDVEAALGATQSKTSRHLRYLAAAGLVRDRREGVRVLYRITDEADENVQGVLGGFAPFADAYGADDDRLGAWLVRKVRAGAAAAARTG
jgi:DNA-binding transcriptional ArsR family regulator